MNIFNEVKGQVTARQAAENYGIRITRNGMACCPFHNDKTPSFTVFPSTQSFYCFGCQTGGDLIEFHRDFIGRMSGSL